jgi:hypothetical protein
MIMHFLPSFRRTNILTTVLKYSSVFYFLNLLMSRNDFLMAFPHEGHSDSVIILIYNLPTPSKLNGYNCIVSHVLCNIEYIQSTKYFEPLFLLMQKCHRPFAKQKRYKKAHKENCYK